MKEIELISREQREALAGRIEVLDKVKELLLLPQVEMATVGVVADYYEVDPDAIKRCYQRHRSEIDADGAKVWTPKTLSEHDVPLAKIGQKYCCLIDGEYVPFPNRGTTLFSKRAILRIGMLLQDSHIAKEVRTQLLNVAEAADTTQRVQAIDDEKDLIFDMGRALASQDYMEVARACNAYIQFQNRHIAAVEESNKALETSNAMLSKQERTWEPRAVINRLIRLYSAVVFGGNFQLGWADYYRELKYRKSISLQQRDGKGSLLDRLKKEEWRDAVAVAAAMCHENAIDPGKAINETNAAVHLMGAVS